MRKPGIYTSAAISIAGGRFGPPPTPLSDYPTDAQKTKREASPDCLVKPPGARTGLLNGLLGCSSVY